MREKESEGREREKVNKRKKRLSEIRDRTVGGE